jgi:hypothetical protein
MVRFKFKKFLEQYYGSPSDLGHYLARYRIKNAPNMETIYKWYQRDTIPSFWFAVLVSLRQIEGKGINVAQFLEGI